MNDEPPKPLEALGDEALEARIVAWVLGEASAFEAAELEERCAGDPDLKRFADQMREMHQLIAVDGKLQSGDEWKLPEAKRRKVVDLLGVEPVVRLKVKKRRFSMKTAALAAAACLMIGLMLWGMSATMGGGSHRIAKLAEDFMEPSVERQRSAGRELRSVALFDDSDGEIETEFLAESVRFAEKKAPADEMSRLGRRGVSLSTELAEHVVDADPFADASAGSNHYAFRYQSESETALPSPSAPSLSTKPSSAMEPLGNSRPESLAKRPAVKSKTSKPDASSHELALGVVPQLGDVPALGRMFRGKNAAATEGGDEMKKMNLWMRDGAQATTWGIPEARAAGSIPGQKIEDVSALAMGDGVVVAGSVTSTELGTKFGTGLQTGEGYGANFFGLEQEGIRADDLVSSLELARNEKAGADALNVSGVDSFYVQPESESMFRGEVAAILPGIVEIDGFVNFGEAIAGRAGASGDLSFESKDSWGDGLSHDFDVDWAGGVSGSLSGGGRMLEEKLVREIEPPAPKDTSLALVDKVPRIGRVPESMESEPAKTTWEEDFAVTDGTRAWKSRHDSNSARGGLRADLSAGEPDGRKKAKAAELGYSGLAQKKMIRRQSQVGESDRLRDEARQAYAGGDYKEAHDGYKESLNALPDAPLLDDRRDFLEESLADAEVARAMEFRRVGKYDEARGMLESAKQRDPGNAFANRELEELDGPVRTNAASAYKPTQNVDEIRRGLYTAEGAYNLGKYDQAREEYESVIRNDPYNKAARRGLERVNAAKTDYYRAAYDQSRAELLMEVDQAWDLAAPADSSESADDSLAAAEERLKGMKAKLASPTKLNDSMSSFAAVEQTPEKKAIQELRDSVQKQEDAVEDKRKTLTTIVRNQELIYSGLGGEGREGGLSSDEEARMAARSFAEISEQKIMLESQIETLLKYDGDQLMSYAAGLQLPRNIALDLQPKYLEEKRQLAKLREDGLGKDHPAIKEQQKIVERMRGDLNEGVTALRETLRAQLELATEQKTRLMAQMDEKKSRAVQQGIGLHSFDDAKKDFEESQKNLEDLKVKLALIEGKPIKREELRQAEVAVPKKDHSATLDAMAEVSAKDEPYSTFSMHVSDASFKLAAAAVERGEVPAAESVRPEEFYNAFDYGDPAPTANEPVACAVEQCAHPAFPQRNLLRIAVRTGAEGRAQSVPLNLTLLLDNSGSMEREDRAQGLSRAVEGLSSLLKEGDTVTVAGFSRQPRLLADRLDGKDAARLNGLVDQTPAEGGTNLEEALNLGGDLAKRQFKKGAQNRVVLFTDGAANLGDADPESLNRKVEQLRNEGIAFDAAGFGADGLNDRLLERLTRNGNGRYYVVDDAQDAGEGFARQLAGAFRPAAENVKVQVVFNPSRVGNYKLIGFEEHRLKKEDFRNDSVDAAEMASEEAGVALYQFEILPEGEGEVGEVSVRFRDTASGEMVEQSWPIPYDPQAPSFDEAKPGLQLAGMAAFVAEKLRGAPLAEAVDYSQLRGVMGRVKGEYAGNERVAQLEGMMRISK